MNHSVIIPEFISYEKIRSFIPEVVKIQKGDNVKWLLSSYKSFISIACKNFSQVVGIKTILRQRRLIMGLGKISTDDRKT